jgi:hypothetical protein
LTIHWESDAASFLATATFVRDQKRFHLIIERLPDQEAWDWTVWVAGQSPDAACHGDAISKLTAMDWAQAAVERWEDS